MIRPDIEMLSRMVRKQIISQQMANELASKPLFIVPLPDTAHVQWMEYINPEKTYSCSQLPTNVVVPFNDFVAILDTMYFHVVLENNHVVHLEYCNTTDINKMYIRLNCLQASSSPEGKCVFQLDRFYEKDHCIVFRDAKQAGWRTSPSVLRTEKLARTILDHFDRITSSAVATILSFIEYQDSLGLYPVKVERDIKPRKGMGSREQLERHQGPHVIYLDRLPSPRSDSGSKTHSDASGGHVRPHERRAHTKTLRHPRYKDHPLYMVENAIRVKPSWVGDKTAIVQGNIYTVLH